MLRLPVFHFVYCYNQKENVQKKIRPALNLHWQQFHAYISTNTKTEMKPRAPLAAWTEKNGHYFYFVLILLTLMTKNLRLSVDITMKSVST